MRAVSVELYEEGTRLYCIQEFIGDEVEAHFTILSQSLA